MLGIEVHVGDETLFEIENSNLFSLHMYQFLIFKYLEGTNMFDAIDPFTLILQVR